MVTRIIGLKFRKFRKNERRISVTVIPIGSRATSTKRVNIKEGVWYLVFQLQDDNKEDV